MNRIYLKEPTISEKEEIIKMCNEIKEVNDKYPFEGISNFKKVLEESYEQFYKELDLNKHIDKINPNYSNQTTFVLIDDTGHIYGAANFRYELKGNLFKIGGHIGYAIRPTERGRGFGTLQLKLLIEKANEIGIDKLLITCRENNIGSKKVMEKFIGQSDSLVPSMYEGIMEYRYWIDVNKSLDKYKGQYKN